MIKVQRDPYVLPCYCISRTLRAKAWEVAAVLRMRLLGESPRLSPWMSVFERLKQKTRVELGVLVWRSQVDRDSYRQQCRLD